MVGKTVQVICGIYKGQRGIVCQINQDEAVLEIPSARSKVYLPKASLEIVEQTYARGADNEDWGAGGKSQYLNGG